MARDYRARPSRYASDAASDPLTIRLPVGLRDELDRYVADAKASGYGFVNRTLIIRDALEAYFETD